MSFSPSLGSTGPVIMPGDARVTRATAEHQGEAFHNRGPVCPGGMGQQQAGVLEAPRCLQATIHLSRVACCHFVSCVLVSWGWEEQLMKKYLCDVQRQSLNTRSVQNNRELENGMSRSYSFSFPRRTPCPTHPHSTASPQGANSRGLGCAQKP